MGLLRQLVQLVFYFADDCTKTMATMMATQQTIEIYEKENTCYPKECLSQTLRQQTGLSDSHKTLLFTSKNFSFLP